MASSDAGAFPFSLEQLQGGLESGFPSRCWTFLCNPEEGCVVFSFFEAGSHLVKPVLAFNSLCSQG